MRKTLSVLALTLLVLGLMDTAVAGLLGWAERSGRLGSLVQYFDYGRSVPGKLARWEETPGIRGDLYDVAWRPDLLAHSARVFAEQAPETGPVVRSYGMSFVDNILRQAKRLDPTLEIDAHSGPGAPPNFTYAMFLDDRPNRRPGDIVVLGLLSSAVPSMAALSNRTMIFEQPAPFTYPIFYPDGDTELRRIDPLIESVAQQRSLRRDPDLAQAWARQLAEEDAFYSTAAFGAPWLDRSPLARLIRRSLAIGHIERTKQKIVAGRSYPYEETLPRMIADFARIARADGQFPVVMLIQARTPQDARLLETAAPTLDRMTIPYLATVEHFDPRNIAGFRGDGHYIPEVDRAFARVFLDLVAPVR